MPVVNLEKWHRCTGVNSLNSKYQLLKGDGNHTGTRGEQTSATRKLSQLEGGSRKKEKNLRGYKGGLCGTKPEGNGEHR